MTPEEFVDGVRRYVQNAAVSDTVEIVVDPPGRSPSADLVELSTWFSRLAADERRLVQRMLEYVARGATFGLFAVLDGSRKVVDAPNGHFELSYVHDSGHRDLLCGPKGAVLHEIL